MTWTATEYIREVVPDLREWCGDEYEGTCPACGGVLFVDVGDGGWYATCEDGCDGDDVHDLLAVPKPLKVGFPTLSRFDFATGEFVPYPMPDGDSDPAPTGSPPAWMKDVPELEKRLHRAVMKWNFTRAAVVVLTTDERRGELWRAGKVPNLVLHPGADLEGVLWYCAYRRLYRVGLDMGCGQAWDVEGVKATLGKYEYLGVVPEVVRCDNPGSDEPTPAQVEPARRTLAEVRGTQAGQALLGLGFRLKPLSEVDDKAAEIKWLWEGIIAKGAVSLLISEPRVGKTTLVAKLLAQMTTHAGGSLLGKAVAPGVVIVLTEESNNDSLWKVRADEFGIDEAKCLVEAPWVGKPTLEQWEETFQRLADVAREMDLSLVVVDTCNEFLPVEDENNATEMKAAVAPLKWLTKAGVSVLLNHHANKNGSGSTATRSRGSNALPAAADIQIDLKEVPKGRTLTTKPRHGYGAKLELFYGDDDDTCAGGPPVPEKIDHTPIYLDLCRESYLTVKEIIAKWATAVPGIEPPSESKVKRDVGKLHTAKNLDRRGKAGRGGGYSYKTK